MPKKIRVLTPEQWVSFLGELAVKLREMRVEVDHQESIINLSAGEYKALIWLEFKLVDCDLSGSVQRATEGIGLVEHLLDVLRSADALTENIQVTLEGVGA